MRNKIEALILAKFTESNANKIRTYCPVCGGGSKKEKSLVATKDSTSINWICWRQKCPAGRGSIILRPADRLYKAYLSTADKIHTPKIDVEYSNLNEAEKLWLLNNWGLTQEQIEINGIKHCDHNNRIYLPIFDHNKRIIGHLERDIQGNSPKVLSFLYTPNYRIHFPASNKDNGGPILLVEDIPSSIRASKFIKSASIMGAHLTESQAFILSTLTEDIILALDQDTWSSPRPPLYYKKKYGMYFNSFLLLYIKDDIKNIDDEKIIGYLHEIYSEQGPVTAG